MRTIWQTLVVMILCAVASACSPAAGTALCDPGATRACTCTTGATGAQSCADDGTRWLSCACTGAAGDAGPVDAAPACEGTVCSGACVHLEVDNAHCGACGNRCAAGEACRSGVCTATDPGVTVIWTFPGLWQLPGSTERYLPTYLQHLNPERVSVPGLPSLYSACAQVTNHRQTPVDVEIEARAAVIAEPGHVRISSLAPGSSRSACVSPSYSLGTLYLGVSASTRDLEVSAMVGSVQVGRAIQRMTVMGRDDVAWTAVMRPTLAEIWTSNGMLATAFVTPNAESVNVLYREASLQSAFGFLSAAYAPQDEVTDTGLAPGGYIFRMVLLGPSDQFQWTLEASNGSVPVYVMNATQFAAYLSTGAHAALQTTTATAGTSRTFVASDTGPHFLLVENSAAARREIRLRRSTTSWDRATDALASVFAALRQRGVVYTSLNATQLRGIQTVRKPDISIGMRSANCLEGALVFASVLEQRGMRPILAIVPGHAFVGVYSGPDAASAQVFIETTLVGDTSSTPFEAMMAAGDNAEAHLRAGDLWLIDLQSARDAGIRPVPF